MTRLRYSDTARKIRNMKRDRYAREVARRALADLLAPPDTVGVDLAALRAYLAGWAARLTMFAEARNMTDDSAIVARELESAIQGAPWSALALCRLAVEMYQFSHVCSAREAWQLIRCQSSLANSPRNVSPLAELVRRLAGSGAGLKGGAA